MTSTITFLDKTGAILDTFGDLSTTPRGWVLNGYGRCEFSVPREHPAFSETLLRVGNLIHVVHQPSTDGGGQLPTWTGIILPPVTWNTPALQIVAYSLEGVLVYRAMPYTTMTGTATSVFLGIAQMLQGGQTTVDARSGSGFGYTGRPFSFLGGQVDNSTDTVYTDDLRTNAFDHIVKAAKTANMEFSCNAEIVDGVFKPYINFKARSTVSSGLSLTKDNTEQADPILTEQGVPWNIINGYNQANTEADRIKVTVIDPESIARYGAFEMNQVFLGTKTQAEVQAAADAAIAKSGRLQRIFKRVALDVDDTFSHLRPGALALVDETRAGFNSRGGLGFRDMVRVLSMDYNDTSNKATLNVEIVSSLFKASAIAPPPILINTQTISGA